MRAHRLAALGCVAFLLLLAVGAVNSHESDEFPMDTAPEEMLVQTIDELGDLRKEFMQKDVDNAEEKLGPGSQAHDDALDEIQTEQFADDDDAAHNSAMLQQIQERIATDGEQQGQQGVDVDENPEKAPEVDAEVLELMRNGDNNADRKDDASADDGHAPVDDDISQRLAQIEGEGVVDHAFHGDDDDAPGSRVADDADGNGENGIDNIPDARKEEEDGAVPDQRPVKRTRIKFAHPIVKRNRIDLDDKENQDENEAVDDAHSRAADEEAGNSPPNPEAEAAAGEVGAEDGDSANGNAKEPQDDGNAEETQDDGNAKEPRDDGNAKETQDDGNAKEPQEDGNAEETQDDGNGKETQGGDQVDDSEKLASQLPDQDVVGSLKQTAGSPKPPVGSSIDGDGALLRRMDFSRPERVPTSSDSMQLSLTEMRPGSVPSTAQARQASRVNQQSAEGAQSATQQGSVGSQQAQAARALVEPLQVRAAPSRSPEAAQAAAAVAQAQGTQISQSSSSQQGRTSAQSSESLQPSALALQKQAEMVKSAARQVDMAKSAATQEMQALGAAVSSTTSIRRQEEASQQKQSVTRAPEQSALSSITPLQVQSAARAPAALPSASSQGASRASPLEQTAVPQSLSGASRPITPTALPQAQGAASLQSRATSATQAALPSASGALLQASPQRQTAAPGSAQNMQATLAAASLQQAASAAPLGGIRAAATYNYNNIPTRAALQQDAS